ncbi:MAG: hypothetical protein APR63_09465 [Desulfuromonas sp. SDB]|nr:MAG: hypothetical protein APR63_09465 [Desulfuromonas sp. SDB]
MFKVTADEVHSFFHGLFDSISIFPMPEYQECRNEPHYYRAGFVCGRAIVVGFIIWLCKG